MNRLLPSLIFLTPVVCSAQGAPVFGGNMPALRPAYTAGDEFKFDLALGYLQEGDIARVPTIEWEILYDPKGAYNYRGIDAAIKKLATKEVVTLWGLQPCPYPTSPWYTSTWHDWWMPKRDLWTDIVKMNSAVVLHIISETKKYSSEPPLFQLWNEPEGSKPGGSNVSKFGEWSPELHELLYKLVKDLRAKGVPKNQIVGPAVSAFGENRRSETAEFLSMMPPKKFDWLSECGYRDFHVRLSAPGAGGNAAKVKEGFQASLDWVNWVDGRFEWPTGQRLMLSELYVTPGDCGVPVGTDMYPFHAIAFDLMKNSHFSHIMAWGLRPGEEDAPNNAYAHFGGMGDSLVRWRAQGK